MAAGCIWPAAGRLAVADRGRRVPAVTEAMPRPADAEFSGQLADLAGDPVLVGLGSVGAPAVQLLVPADQAGVVGAQPTEEPLPGAGPQVQHDRWYLAPAAAIWRTVSASWAGESER